jgi:peptidyl-prolyl cis-trans isomerase D
MAIIGNIRERYGMVITIVIAFALLGFLLMTAFESQTNLFRSQDTTIAEVDGDKVDYIEYNAKVESNVEQYKLFQNKTPDEATMTSIREQTYNEIVQARIMEKKYAQNGIAITLEEMKQQCGGQNPHSVIKQQFSDPKTKQYNPANVPQFFNTSYKENKNNEVQRWEYIEKYIKEDRYKNKFGALIKKAIYMPKWQATMAYNEQNTKANIEWCSYPYSKIADDQIKPTDEELKKYIAAHPNRFKQEASVKIEYVEFAIVPSKEDSMAAKGKIVVLIDSFRRTNNDSVFVMSNTEGDLNGNYLSPSKVVSVVKDSLLSKSVGSLVGPYLENNYVKISKIIGRKLLPDSVRARHILIKTTGDSSVANRKIDSIRLKVKAGADFGALAMQYSEDEGSKEKAGDLGYFEQGMMVPQFNDACFGGKTGDLVKVLTSFGVHLIQITDQKNFNLANRIFTISKVLLPSSATEQSISANANEFAANNRTAAAFDKAITTKGLNKKIAEKLTYNETNLNGVSAREVIKWAIGANKDEVSNVIAVDGKLFIAKVVAKREKGVADVDAVRTEVEMLVKKDKKAEKIMADLAAKTAGKSTIGLLSAAIGDSIHKADQISFAQPFIMNVGYEPNLVGAIFGAKPNTISKAIKGENAVYYFNLVNMVPAPAATPEALKQQSSQTMQQSIQSVDYSLPESLKKQMDVKDNRSVFF